MKSPTNEQALESAIEKKLTGTCLEELKDSADIANNILAEPMSEYVVDNGFIVGYPSDFNKESELQVIEQLRFPFFIQDIISPHLRSILKKEYPFYPQRGYSP